MTFILPGQDKRWVQTNASDRFGTLAWSRQIDLDDQGYLKLAKRTRNIFDEDSDAQFGVPVGFAYDSATDRHYVLTDDKIFYIDNTFQTITEDTNTNVPTTLGTGSDIVSFNGQILVSAGITDGLKSWDNPGWSIKLYALTDNNAPMTVFENRNELAIGQDNTVVLLDTSYFVQKTLTIPDEYRVTTLAWSNNRLYIGTRHRFNGDALLFEWDGATTSANNGYPSGSVAIDCVKPYQGTVVAFTRIGQLLFFNGSGLAELANLPIYYSNRIYGNAGNNLTGETSHRGMVVDGDIILMNIRTNLEASGDNDLQATFLNDFPAGVWAYDPRVGLYHKHSVPASIRTQTNAVTTGNVNTSTEVITVAGATVPATGTPVLYDDGSDGAGTAIGGLTHRKKYYVINQSSTTMKLATTKANADAGTAIDLTGTGNNNQFFVFLSNADFGNDRTAQATALGKISIPDPIPSDAKQLLIGGTVNKTDVSTTKHVLGVLADEQENRGVFVTALLDAANSRDSFTNLTVKFSGVKTAEDKIIIKTKVGDRDDEHKYLDTARTQTGTWSDANTFTTTADLSDVGAGDEITIHSGSGAGYTAHIDSLSEAGGTYTVNIDESVQNISASDTMLYTVDTWKKEFEITTADLDTISNDESSFTATGGVKEQQISRKSRRLQIKVEMRGEDVRIEDMLLDNVPFNTLAA